MEVQVLSFAPLFFISRVTSRPVFGGVPGMPPITASAARRLGCMHWSSATSVPVMSECRRGRATLQPASDPGVPSSRKALLGRRVRRLAPSRRPSGRRPDSRAHRTAARLPRACLGSSGQQAMPRRQLSFHPSAVRAMQLASFPVASLVHDRHATREGLLVVPRGDFLSLDRISLESADCVPLALYLERYGLTEPRDPHAVTSDMNRNLVSRKPRPRVDCLAGARARRCCQRGAHNGWLTPPSASSWSSESSKQSSSGGGLRVMIRSHTKAAAASATSPASTVVGRSARARANAQS